MNRSTPCTTAYVSNTPPVEAHAPIEMHHLGSGICCQIRCRTGNIFITTRPATIIKSHCRGLKRKTSEPKRAISCRLAPTAINSMPQQAVAKGIGHRLFFRHQLTSASSLVVATWSIRSGVGISCLLFVFGRRLPEIGKTTDNRGYRHWNTPFFQSYTNP